MMTSTNGNIFRVTDPLCGDSPQKGQWHGALMCSLIYAWTNNWAINRDAGDLRRHYTHYDVTVIICEMATIWSWGRRANYVNNMVAPCFHASPERLWPWYWPYMMFMLTHNLSLAISELSYHGDDVGGDGEALADRGSSGPAVHRRFPGRSVLEIPNPRLTERCIPVGFSATGNVTALRKFSKANASTDCRRRLGTWHQTNLSTVIVIMVVGFWPCYNLWWHFPWCIFGATIRRS